MKKSNLITLMAALLLLPFALAGCSEDQDEYAEEAVLADGTDSGSRAGKEENAGDAEEAFDYVFSSNDTEFNMEDDEDVMALRSFFGKAYFEGEINNEDNRLDGTELSNFNGIWPNDAYTFFGNGSEAYTVINTREELAAVYRGKVEIPEVDFSDFSLLLGCVHTPATSVYKLQGYTVQSNADVTRLTFAFDLIEGPIAFYYNTLGNYYFSEIVPKFEPGKKLEIECEAAPLPF